MKKDSLLNILIIICSIMIIIGIVIIFTKKEKNPNEEIISSPTASPIISPTDNPIKPKYERITFSVGMEIYFNPEKNSVCDNYTEENSYIGINNGCMRFYGLSNEYGYVNMILDHDLNKIPTNWASRQDYPNESTIERVGISNYGNREVRPAALPVHRCRSLCFQTRAIPRRGTRVHRKVRSDNPGG